MMHKCNELKEDTIEILKDRLSSLSICKKNFDYSIKYINQKTLSDLQQKIQWKSIVENVRSMLNPTNLKF